ncbi:hypothetical protein [Rhodococcus sp. B10]|uniref:hypothetical protein n=1 Tax=Rhodococcus sp. B10 TaxID=2695876 RepID=UPI0014315E97
MSRATLKVCRIAGCPRMQAGPLCREHAKDRERHQRATVPTKATRDGEEQARRKAAVDAHRAINGEWCPGIGRPAHYLTERDGGLTANHVTPIALGGDPRGPLSVTCRSCNSRQAARF